MKTSVLLAAFETEVIQTLPLILMAAGHRVQIAASGLDALNKARRRPPNLIILDASLPDMDVTTICEILSLLPSTNAVPRLLLEARSQVFSTLPAHGHAPPKDTVPPFNPEELLSRINKALGQQPEYPCFNTDLDSP
jgi:DNA-binding response OmpR family regulator